MARTRGGMFLGFCIFLLLINVHDLKSDSGYLLLILNSVTDFVLIWYFCDDFFDFVMIF